MKNNRCFSKYFFHVFLIALVSVFLVSEISAQSTCTMNEYGTLKLLGQPTSAYMYVEVRDNIAGTIVNLPVQTFTDGTFSFSYTFQADGGFVSFGFSYYALLDNGTIQTFGGVGGGYICGRDKHWLPHSYHLNGPSHNTPQNAGPYCEGMVGEPVNVTNGNMFIHHTDRFLNKPISISRNYNSMLSTTGLFGYGWQSELDERVVYSNLGNGFVTYSTSSGRVSYAYKSTGNLYLPLATDVYEKIVLNDTTDYSFSVFFKDGSIRNYHQGKIRWKKDRNNNQITYSYDTNGRLNGVSDEFGNSLAIVTNSNNTISQISDDLGAVASYEYHASPNQHLLKTVIYPDNSKYKFEYVDISGKSYLSTVKNANDHVLETHLYDSQGRAYTSEKSGGIEKYTLDFTNVSASTDPHTIVTDALGRVTKYYVDKSKGKDLVTKIEGVCSCGGGSEITEFEYDDKRNIIKKTDALSRITSYSYDANGNIASVTDDLGSLKFTYNAFNQILTYKDYVDSQDPDPGVNTIANTYS